MKPKEFDELLTQKFEQNDFEYNPRNWDRLEEQMDGRAKKRSIILLWLAPLATGIAASVALAIGFTSMWRHAATGNAGVATFAQAFNYKPAQDAQGALQYTTTPGRQYASATRHTQKKAAKQNKEAEETTFGINLQNAIGFNRVKKVTTINLLGIADPDAAKKKDKKKEVAATKGYNTFKPEEIKPAPKTSVMLSGGYNQGNQNSGYAAGATIRHMISDNVFIESDVAFVSSNNSIGITENYNVQIASKGAAPASGAAKTTKTTGEPTGSSWAAQSNAINENYNMSYAQVSPAIGVQIMKRLSIAAGPDFQQALADNRPASITNNTYDNVSVMPLFDLGVIGKTEYSVTKKIKAQLSYRKGINNAFSLNDKFINRDYMQVQVRCSIFNK